MWDRHQRLLWLADLEQLPVLPWTLIVPGHGPLVTDAAPFAQMRDYLGWLDGAARGGDPQDASSRFVGALSCGCGSSPARNSSPQRRMSL